MMKQRVKELKEKRTKLVKRQWKEYQTLGNTQRCQELFVEIERIEKEIAELEERER